MIPFSIALCTGQPTVDERSNANVCKCVCNNPAPDADVKADEAESDVGSRQGLVNFSICMQN
jgi:hypothetical protein